MNIENSSLLSLFSSGASIETLQQTLQTEALVSEEFAEALLATMQQFNSLDEAVNLETQTIVAEDISEQLTAQLKLINEDDGFNKLQGFADLIGQRLPAIEQTVEKIIDDVAIIETDLKDVTLDEIVLDFANDHFIGNKELGNDIAHSEVISEAVKVDEIDLDDTLSALVNVMNTLESIDAEQGGLDKEGLTKAAKIFSFERQAIKPVREKVENISTEWVKPEALENKLDTDIEKNLLNKEKTLENAELKATELTQNKEVAKFTTDIANLNRAVLPNQKAELPAMTKHFAHPEWNKEVGERVIWMHKQAIPSAELRLNPQHLGPVTVKVDVTQDQQVTVSFTAQHAAVKEALEAAVPKLREMLNGQQLNLVDVNVTQDDSRQRQSQNFSQMGQNSGERAQDEASDQPQNEAEEKVLNIADEIEAGRAIASQGVLSLFA